MTEISVWTEPQGEESESICACCDRLLHEGEGVLISESGDLADYAYRWADGHESRFSLAVSACDEHGEPCGLAVVSCRSDGESLIYSIVEPADSPWPDNDVFGPVLSRHQILVEKLVPSLFNLVDAITTNDDRISSRILSASLL